MREINFRCKRIVDLDTVDQHNCVIGLGTANAYLRNRTDRTLTADGDSWHRSQRIGDKPDLSLLEFRARNEC